MAVMQRIDVVQGGIPPRLELEAMLASPRSTDVPQHWVHRLITARDHLDQADLSPDGSERLIELTDAASDIEDEAIKQFLR